MPSTTRFALAAAVLLTLAASTWAAETRPNVLFITIDDLCAQAVGCYEGKAVHTPNLDRLAREGMQFNRAYVQVTFCNPSRTSFLTGLRPDRTGVLDNTTHFRKLLPDVVTLPQYFRESGYTTMRLGKIYHGTAKMDDPKAWDIVEYPEPTPLGRKGQKRSPAGGKIKWCWFMAAEGDDEDQPDGQIAAKAISFLKQKHEKPFFLAVGFHKPHDPFVAPAKYFERYPLEGLKLHTDPTDMSPTHPMQLGAWKPIFDQFTDRERREFLQAYYACTTFMDAQLGKVLETLKQQGLAKNTVVFLMSDHGYHLGERGWWNKSTLYEWSAHSPMILHVPGRQGMGQPCNRLVEFLDVYPTLVELCGLAPPKHLEGKSLVALLDDPAAAHKSTAFTQVKRGKSMGRSVRTDRYRYIEFDDGREGAEFFDHEKDPGEFHNLADDPEFAEIVAAHGKLLQEASRK
ncbi:MAG: sulfatase [Planctomycetota bacterium]